MKRRPAARVIYLIACAGVLTDLRGDFMNKITKNIIIVVFTGIFNLTLSTILGFVVSRFFDYDNYAYYKMYFLYITFVGFAHLGFINGIYLEYGKYDYSKLPYPKFHTYFIILVILQVFIMICAVPFILLCNSSIDKKIVLFFVFGNLPFININCFFSLINQFTKRFRIDSIVNIGKGVLDCFVIILTLAGVFNNYLKMLFFVLLENVVVLSINIFFNRKIVFTTGLKKQNIFLTCRKYITKGFFIMVSEFIGLIILEIDGLFAEHLFDLKVFAIYSFASTVIAMFYAIISTVSNLIYPYLVRVDYHKLKNHYIVLSEVVLVIAIVGMSMVYLVRNMIQIVIPNYSGSIYLISILALTIPFKALIVLIDNNFFKVMKLSSIFLSVIFLL